MEFLSKVPIRTVYQFINYFGYLQYHPPRWGDIGRVDSSAFTFFNPVNLEAPDAGLPDLPEQD